MKRNEHTCRWRVDFRELAYDGGGSESWTQHYFTKLGALVSKFLHLRLRSWGGKALLIDLEEDLSAQEIEYRMSIQKRV